jgi:transposase
VVIISSIKCPYCGFEGGFKALKTWKFRFYEVKSLECPSCHGVFNYYQGVSPSGKKSEFTIRVRPRKHGSG